MDVLPTGAGVPERKPVNTSDTPQTAKLSTSNAMKSWATQPVARLRRASSIATSRGAAIRGGWRAEYRKATYRPQGNAGAGVRPENQAVSLAFARFGAHCAIRCAA